ncbi:polysaccharide biosynthesis/export family protein [Laspinema olomoucense]|uniref:polysaccharide biosynthesis/export family protein n=1 Tax=Laspinema olomoucense TaxID=3231600 RepID=UPI0021BA63E0|nr:polysaccharide biosynthesis/export family protein [Laspinema sp. D3a]MCT7990852.1 polysaccharide biosynthesis/export family protein [Laspinema sp. D3a]
MKYLCHDISATVGFLALLAAIAHASVVPSLAQAPGTAPASSILALDAGNDQLTSPYRLGSGDRLRIDIFDAPDYSGDTTVLLDGTINLILVGSIMVEGLTLEEARAAISAKYASVFKRPVVNLSLVAPRPVQISIVGEVISPGNYTFELLEPGGAALGFKYPTLVEAIEQAQGLRLSANLENIQVRRVENLGTERVITVNLWDFLERGNKTQNLILRDGDTIYVPTVTSASLNQVRQLASSPFVQNPEAPRQVMVVGEVITPGVYVLLGGVTGVDIRAGGLPTVIRALEQAGGIKTEADIRRIQVRRLTISGAEQIIPVNLWQLLQAGDFTQDMVLQDGDVVFVPTATDVNPSEVAELTSAVFSRQTIEVYVVGEVGRFGYEKIEVTPNTSLNQALLAVGGFTPSSRKDQVELLRLNDDGTVIQRRIPVDFSQRINEQTNPRLQDNDIIVVDRSKFDETFRNINTILSPVPAINSLFRIFEILNFLGD